MSTRMKSNVPNCVIPFKGDDVFVIAAGTAQLSRQRMDLLTWSCDIVGKVPLSPATVLCLG